MDSFDRSGVGDISAPRKMIGTSYPLIYNFSRNRDRFSYSFVLLITCPQCLVFWNSADVIEAKRAS